MTARPPRRGVVTLTPAGAIDATYLVDGFARGDLIRASEYAREVSGKGVNLSAALDLAGVPTAAVVVLGHDDLAFAGHSPHAGMLRIVPVPGATRVNTAIVDADGATTKVNAPTPPLSADAWAQATDTALSEAAASGAEWLVLCGSLPVLAGTGRPVDATELFTRARERGIRVAVDTSGTGLARALGATPDLDLIKPNTAELAELTGRALVTVGDVVAAARTLIDRGLRLAYVSMGADGALAVSADEVVHAHARPRRLGNTAGAGDASLAGFLVGLADGGSAPLESAVAHAAAWGAHAVAQTTTVLPGLGGLPEAVVTVAPDPATALSEPAGGA
ncbi:1-phosphofructokinase family hexose kinase [Microbacterium sp. dk485]|uniref:1-phosphofructokinase family hexose kinase n=1 Tax=Microbacterium sp. dk485 TaxID=2560021 RepID=UPI0010749584|nr:hexose kinase [Microbacterium sp. dk485]TFV85048.1 1-phosphofructokinase family hexose kinase [Microbacterium sp. dk485]